MLAQRLHTGFWLSQRTFDAEHASHEDLSFCGASVEDAGRAAASGAILLDMVLVLHAQGSVDLRKMIRSGLNSAGSYPVVLGRGVSYHVIPWSATELPKRTSEIDVLPGATHTSLQIQQDVHLGPIIHRSESLKYGDPVLRWIRI